MLKTLLIYLIFLSISFTGFNAYANGVKTADNKIISKIDSSKISFLKFNKEALNDYRNQKEFKYDDAPTTELSLWDKFWMWFWDKVGRLFQGAASNPISKYFFVLLGIGIVVFIIIKVIGSDSIFIKKSKETILPYDVLNENIHDIDYEAELQKLIAKGRYRLAVRLLYLSCLKKLSDAEIIQWQPEKTNYNYLSEISDPNIKTNFSTLTHQFDYIWYGDFPVDENGFEPISQSFKQFNAQIK